MTMLKKNFTLRDYQLAFQRNIAIALKQHQRVIACSATGSGKTKTFVDTAAKAQAKGRTVLIISESTKIFPQIESEIAATPISAGRNYKNIQPGFVYLGMAQTLMRRPHLIEQFAQQGNKLLIIYDECHVGTGANILKQMGTSLLIGFSATPEGKHLQQIYNHCVVGPQPHELVVAGHLCGYRHCARERADIAQLQLNSRGDEYSEESQENVFESDAVYEGLMDDLHTAKFRKALIYCASIRDCEHTYNTLTQAGFTCVRMHTKMSQDDQAEAMKKFENGLTPIMINVAMLTKGYDYDAIDFVGLKLKTKSLSKYIQMCGRASRVLKGEEDLPIEQRTKKQFTVYDYGQNWKMHMQWDYEHDWASIWQGKPPKRPGVPPIKYCPQCEFLCAASAKKCPNCGYEFLVINLDIEEPHPETVLIEVTNPYAELMGKKVGELNPTQLATYAISKNKKLFAIRVARAHAQHDPGFLRAFGAAMNYKYAWAQRMLNELPVEPIEFNDFILR